MHSVRLFLLLLSVFVVARAGRAQDLPEAALRRIAASQAEKAARTPAQRKIDSALLFSTRARQGRLTPEETTRRRPALDVDPADRVLVDITGDFTAASRAAITAAGGQVVSELPAFRFLRARLPFDSLEAIAARPEVQRINVAAEGRTRKVNTSQGDQAHRAVQARALGPTGAGIGVGVVSNGVSTLGSRQASGDLPPGITVLPGQAGAGDEGTAMLEIIHDLAPGATLYFATGLGGSANMANNIVALCSAGVRIIVDDLGYLSDAVFEDGVVAQAVNTVTANGCHYFSAAGNAGNLNDGTAGVWEGDYTAVQSTFGFGPVLNFGAGVASNAITTDPPDVITLQWSDKWGSSANDYDLYLFSSDLSTLFDSSENVQNGTGIPLETIDSGSFNDSGNRLVVVLSLGVGRYLHLNTNGGGLTRRTAGQIFGHPAASLAYAVGAVNVATGPAGFTGGPANPLETFSSDGPRRMFYAPNGAAITPGNFSSSGGAVRQKPEIVAADGVATATPGYNPFFGTSAAAPHAAAIGALTLQAAGGPTSLSVTGLRSLLLGSAWDIEAAGIDRDSGNGIVDALRAVSAAQPFEDNPLLSTVHNVRGVHITQLRTKIDNARIRYGLTPFSWTDPAIVLGATLVRSVHVQEMRTALSAVYVASGRTAPGFTDANLTAALVRAVHISELRTAVANLP